MSADFKEQLAAALAGGGTAASSPQDSSTLASVVRIIGVTAQLDEEQLNDDSRLVDDLHIDSLTLLEIAVRLEDRFGVEVEAEDVAEAGTVGALAELVSAAGLVGDDAKEQADG